MLTNQIVDILHFNDKTQYGLYWNEKQSYNHVG